MDMCSFMVMLRRATSPYAAKFFTQCQLYPSELTYTYSDPDGDVVTFASTGGPSWATVVANGSGSSKLRLSPSDTAALQYTSGTQLLNRPVGLNLRLMTTVAGQSKGIVEAVNIRVIDLPTVPSASPGVSILGAEGDLAEMKIVDAIDPRLTVQSISCSDPNSTNGICPVFAWTSSVCDQISNTYCLKDNSGAKSLNLRWTPSYTAARIDRTGGTESFLPYKFNFIVSSKLTDHEQAQIDPLSRHLPTEAADYPTFDSTSAGWRLTIDNTDRGSEYIEEQSLMSRNCVAPCSSITSETLTGSAGSPSFRTYAEWSLAENGSNYQIDLKLKDNDTEDQDPEALTPVVESVSCVHQRKSQAQSCSDLGVTSTITGDRVSFNVNGFEAAYKESEAAEYGKYPLGKYYFTVNTAGKYKNSLFLQNPGVKLYFEVLVANVDRPAIITAVSALPLNSNENASTTLDVSAKDDDGDRIILCLSSLATDQGVGAVSFSKDFVNTKENYIESTETHKSIDFAPSTTGEFTIATRKTSVVPVKAIFKAKSVSWEYVGLPSCTSTPDGQMESTNFIANFNKVNVDRKPVLTFKNISPATINEIAPNDIQVGVVEDLDPEDVSTLMYCTKKPADATIATGDSDGPLSARSLGYNCFRNASKLVTLPSLTVGQDFADRGTNPRNLSFTDNIACYKEESVSVVNAASDVGIEGCYNPANTWSLNINDEDRAPRILWTGSNPGSCTEGQSCTFNVQAFDDDVYDQNKLVALIDVQGIGAAGFTPVNLNSGGTAALTASSISHDIVPHPLQIPDVGRTVSVEAIVGYRTGPYTNSGSVQRNLLVADVDRAPVANDVDVFPLAQEFYDFNHDAPRWPGLNWSGTNHVLVIGSFKKIGDWKNISGYGTYSNRSNFIYYDDEGTEVPMFGTTIYPEYRLFGGCGFFFTPEYNACTRSMLFTSTLPPDYMDAKVGTYWYNFTDPDGDGQFLSKHNNGPIVGNGDLLKFIDDRGVTPKLGAPEVPGNFEETYEVTTYRASYDILYDGRNFNLDDSNVTSPDAVIKEELPDYKRMFTCGLNGRCEFMRNQIHEYLYVVRTRPSLKSSNKKSLRSNIACATDLYWNRSRKLRWKDEHYHQDEGWQKRSLDSSPGFDTMVWYDSKKWGEMVPPNLRGPMGTGIRPLEKCIYAREALKVLLDKTPDSEPDNFPIMLWWGGSDNP
ncbi:MAG: hypothetical protein EOP06_02865 [Proteobacteria bacterium]|nr:MAG: hypothetical protein EOP06_02865 [Pseudomonadota bacterium]